MHEQANSWTEAEIAHSYFIECCICNSPPNNFCRRIVWTNGAPTVIIRPEGPHARRVKLALRYVPMEDKES